MSKDGQYNTPDSLMDYAYEGITGCWIWIGQFTNSGYAKATIRYKTRLVHRFLYGFSTAFCFRDCSRQNQRPR